jgi:hypothetical protein
VAGSYADGNSDMDSPINKNTYTVEKGHVLLLIKLENCGANACGFRRERWQPISVKKIGIRVQ